MELADYYSPVLSLGRHAPSFVQALMTSPEMLQGASMISLWLFVGLGFLTYPLSDSLKGGGLGINQIRNIGVVFGALGVAAMKSSDAPAVRAARLFILTFALSLAFGGLGIWFSDKADSFQRSDAAIAQHP